jgi:hypothetical protein
MTACYTLSVSPDVTCATDGYDSKLKFCPPQATLTPPDDIIGAMMPAVLQLQDDLGGTAKKLSTKEALEHCKQLPVRSWRYCIFGGRFLSIDLFKYS